MIRGLQLYYKFSRRKSLDDLKRATVQDPCDGVLFNEIAGINSRPGTSAKKSLHQGCLPVNILELSALLQEGRT